MSFEWNVAKAKANLRKHGVDFADAAVALEDEYTVTMEDPTADDEQRFVSLCRDPSGRLLVIVFTNRGERIRVISARRATGRERKEYEGGGT